MNFGNMDIAMSLQIIILLMLIGAAIKHVKFFDKVSNSLIPIILIIIGVVVGVFMFWPLTKANFMEAFITGLASACIAIGLHQAGKNIFINGAIVDAFSNKFLSSSDSKNEEETSSDKKE